MFLQLKIKKNQFRIQLTSNVHHHYRYSNCYKFSNFCKEGCQTKLRKVVRVHWHKILAVVLNMFQIPRGQVRLPYFFSRQVHSVLSWSCKLSPGLAWRTEVEAGCKLRIIPTHGLYLTVVLKHTFFEDDGSVQFSSIQFKMASIIMPSILSLRSFPNVAFETVPMFVWLTMTLSRPFKEGHLALPLPRLSLPGDRWCGVFSFVPAGSVSSFSLLQIFRSKPLVRVALVASLSARALHFTPVCPGQCTHRSFRRWM